MDVIASPPNMPFTPAQCKLLDDNLEAFSEQMDLEAVLVYLERYQVLTEAQGKLLWISPTGVQELLSLLKQSSHSSAAFDALHGALSNCAQEHLADLLLPELSHCSSSAPLQCFSELESENLGILLARRLSVPSPPPQHIPEEHKVAPDPEPDGILDLDVKMCTNSKPDETDDTVYANYSKPKGLALIFNNTFHAEAEPDWRRDGSDVDANNMKQLLQKLGYQVQIETELTANEMKTSLKNFSKRPEHADADSCVVVVLSHGSKNRIYGIDWKFLLPDKFTDRLNAKFCPLLNGKPKLFFIQACRGYARDTGFEAPFPTVANEPVSDISADDVLKEAEYEQTQTDAVPCKKLPTPADMFIAQSSSAGYVSWRNTKQGSWFIQELCQTIAQYAREKCIIQIMTMVNKQVSERVSSRGFCQMPEWTARFRKTFFFFPGVYR